MPDITCMLGGILDMLRDLSAMFEHPATEQVSFDIPTANALAKDEDKLNTMLVIAWTETAETNCSQD